MMQRMAAMVWSASQWELHLTWHRNGQLTSMHLLCTEGIWEGFEENSIRGGDVRPLIQEKAGMSP